MNDVPHHGFGLPLAGDRRVAPTASPAAVAPPVTAPLAPAPAARAPGGIAPSSTRIGLDDLLLHVLGEGGSDLHLTVGAPPTVRVRGEMQAIEGYPALTSEQLAALVGERTA